MLTYIFRFCKAARQYFGHVIHPRRLIIASDKKVMQFTINVPIQLCALLLFSGGVIWSSYATGRFIAAGTTLEAQNNVLRAVTSKQVGNMFPSLLPSASGGSNVRMALLEQQVAELKNANEEIVERVRVKTDGHIEDLESIVSQTGLNPSAIKKRVRKIQRENMEKAEGGPYIPTNMPKIPDDTSTMFNSLDELKILRQVVANLPLGVPIKNAEERSAFGHRIDPFNGEMAFHSGLDLAAPVDSQILSTADGIVISAGRDGAYGNVVDIAHGFGIVTRYGHLSKINVQKGDKVAKGDIIGIQGSTGRSTGLHLHYEVRYNGEAINPQKFLQTGKLLELGNAVSQD